MSPDATTVPASARSRSSRPPPRDATTRSRTTGQHRRLGAALARAADLLVVEQDEDRHVRGPVAGGGDGLDERPRPGVRRPEVVQPGRGQQLPGAAEPRGRLGVVGHDVPAEDVAPGDADLPGQPLGDVLGCVAEPPDGGEVALRSRESPSLAVRSRWMASMATRSSGSLPVSSRCPTPPGASGSRTATRPDRARSRSSQVAAAGRRRPRPRAAASPRTRRRAGLEPQVGAVGVGGDDAERGGRGELRVGAPRDERAAAHEVEPPGTVGTGRSRRPGRSRPPRAASPPGPPRGTGWATRRRTP